MPDHTHVPYLTKTGTFCTVCDRRMGPVPAACEVDDCDQPATPCQCGAAHCDDHPHIDDYEASVCDVCGEDEHTPEQLRECIDSATGIRRTTYRGYDVTILPDARWRFGPLTFETPNDCRRYMKHLPIRKDTP